MTGCPADDYICANTLGVGLCHKTRGNGLGEGGERMEKYSWVGLCLDCEGLYLDCVGKCFVTFIFKL